MSELREILRELADAFGPSGSEAEVREILRKRLVAKAEISLDNLGSIIAVKNGKSLQPKILLAAHLDEVGLMVRGIFGCGYLKVVPLGSWWPPTLIGQRVVIRSKGGDRYGVIGAKPPHFLSKEAKKEQLQISDLYVDLGVGSLAEVAALGIEVGDPIVPAVRAEYINNGSNLIGKAFDDRVGCAAIIQILNELGSEHPNQVIGAGTVQEENGLKGARTVAAMTSPDLAIVVEGPPADDFPDNSGIVQGRLGGGPQIRWLDPSMIANRALVKLAIEQAKAMGIPYQVTVREGGGTDGGEIQLQGMGGVPTVVIGVPVRNAHSPQGIVSISDLEATVRLIKQLIMVLDGPMVERIKREPWGG